MEKEILKEICKKYNKGEKLIKILFYMTIRDGYNIIEAFTLIDDFYKNGYKMDTLS